MHAIDAQSEFCQLPSCWFDDTPNETMRIGAWNPGNVTCDWAFLGREFYL